jgi:hypothetical protein
MLLQVSGLFWPELGGFFLRNDAVKAPIHLASCLWDYSRNRLQRNTRKNIENSANHNTYMPWMNHIHIQNPCTCTPMCVMYLNIRQVTAVCSSIVPWAWGVSSFTDSGTRGISSFTDSGTRAENIDRENNRSWREVRGISSFTDSGTKGICSGNLFVHWLREGTLIYFLFIFWLIVDASIYFLFIFWLIEGALIYFYLFFD